jgi:18S rRNA (guanine1575-N7)-methyltransferase
MRQIQLQMAERAYELLSLRELDGTPAKSKLILDIGCGVGLSGQILTENDHIWVGTDLSRAMLGWCLSLVSLFSLLLL